MKKSNLFKLCTIVLLGVSIVSCHKSKFPGYTETDNGLYYKIIKKAEKENVAKIGEIVAIDFALKTENDSVFNASKFKLEVTKPTYKGDINEAFSLLSVGDSFSLIVSTDSFMLKSNGIRELPPFLKKGSMMHIDIKIASKQTKEEAEKEEKEFRDKQNSIMEEMQKLEIEKLSKYIADNKITTKPTQSGLYVIETKKGKGKKVEKGKKVSVHYVLTLMDGKKIDSSIDRNEPFEFTVGRGEVIPGWDEGIGMLSVGSKAKIIVPSSLGYGQRQQGPIPAFSTLIFEVELINVK